MLEKISTINELAVAAMVMIPFVTAIVHMIKQSFAVSARYIPVVAFLVGIATGLLMIEVSVIGGVVGAMIGLGGTGLYEVGRTSVMNKKR